MSSHEDDDLDDLDDVLDEFTDDVSVGPVTNDTPDNIISTKSNEEQGQSQTSAPQTTGTAVKSTETKSTKAADEEKAIPELDDELAKKLKEGMSVLLGDSEGTDGAEALEKLISELNVATGGTSLEDKKSSKSPAGFQDTIAQTMDRLKESKDEMDDKSKESSSENAFLSNLMSELEGASGVDGGLDGFLGEMLRDLSSKEILYEPMKEMHDKYPEWLENNKNKISADELTRYENHKRVVAEIVLRFESASYSDDNEADRKYIADRMEEMQSMGAPPADLMGDISAGALPGMSGGDDFPSDKDLENCKVQ